jgi:hypothetical protein
MSELARGRAPYVALQIPSQTRIRTPLRLRIAAMLQDVNPINRKTVPIMMPATWSRSIVTASFGKRMPPLFTRRCYFSTKVLFLRCASTTNLHEINFVGGGPVLINSLFSEVAASDLTYQYSSFTIWPYERSRWRGGRCRVLPISITAGLR